MKAQEYTYHQSQQQIQDEAVIIEQAKQNPERFQPLYDRYYKPVFRYFYKRVSSEAIAADLTSQLFVKVLQKIKTYENRGIPFSSWLFRIAYSIVNDYYRKKKKRVITVQTEDILDWFSEGESSDSNDQEEKMVKVQWVTEALKKLKPEQIDLVEMRFFEGLSFKEIGEILEIKENTAKVRCFRITEKLMKSWKKHEKDVS